MSLIFLIFDIKQWKIKAIMSLKSSFPIISHYFFENISIKYNVNKYLLKIDGMTLKYKITFINHYLK